MTNALDELDRLAREAVSGVPGTRMYAEVAFERRLSPAVYLELSARLRKAQEALESLDSAVAAYSSDFNFHECGGDISCDRCLLINAHASADQALAALAAPLPGVDG